MLKAVAACRLFTGLKSDWTRLGGWRQVEALDDERLVLRHRGRDVITDDSKHLIKLKMDFL